MISVDTNILVRLLTNDDKTQASFAKTLIENNTIFISKTVLLETEWVLRFSYELRSESIASVFEKLLGLEQIHIEDPICIAQALEWYANDMDFADALHLASSKTAQGFATFDKNLIKEAKKYKINLINPE